MDYFDNDFGMNAQNDGFTDDFSDDFFNDEEFGPGVDDDAEDQADYADADSGRFRISPEPINLSRGQEPFVSRFTPKRNTNNRQQEVFAAAAPEVQPVEPAPVVIEAPAYPEEPAYTEVPAYSEEPAYTEAPTYSEEPAYTETPAYSEEPAYTEAPAYSEEPAYTEAPAYSEAPVYNEVPENTKSPAELLVDYMDCHYKLIPAGTDINDINHKYLYALRYGAEWGYSTVMIPVSGELSDRICLDENGRAYSVESLREIRKNRLAMSDRLDTRVIEDRYAQKTAVIASKGISIEDFENAGIPGVAINCFSSFVKNGFSTCDLLIAQVPVSEPWQLFAWMRTGGINGSPSDEELMAASKSWYDLCGAVPAVIGYGSVEYFVPNGKPTPEMALKIAREQFAICHERVLRLTRSHSLGELVNTLTKSCVWYLGWK